MWFNQGEPKWPYQMGQPDARVLAVESAAIREVLGIGIGISMKAALDADLDRIESQQS